jgi:nucleotide-binding universal stress UspA family protein
MNKKYFVVPHDFTPAANFALEHAIVTAKQLHAAVYVLHVVSKEKQLKKAEDDLKEVLEKKADQGVELIPVVRIGSIVEDIGDFAAEHHASIVFMGTHGAHGWQHITGSKALKVITYSSVPFVIVQDKSIKPTGYDDIVVPMDLHKETKQKLAIVANLADYFDSRVHVITPDETDEYLKEQVQSNIAFAKKFFKGRNIELKTYVAPSAGFDKEVVKYAIQIDADLIAIMNMHKNMFFPAMTSNYEQYIITNDAKIPALVVNPIELDTYGKSVLFS